MTNKLNFTKRSIDGLPLPEGSKRAYYNDEQVKGLQLAVTSKGAKSFVLYRRLEGKPTRLKLGDYPAMTPAIARQEAYKLLGEISKGENPQTKKVAERANKVTLLEAFEAYVSTRKHNLKEKTLYDYRRLMTTAFKDWHRKRLVDITKANVQRKHQALTTNSGPSYANSAMRVLNAVFNFSQYQYEDAQGNPLIPVNPVDILSRTRTWNRTKPRERYIQPHQLKAFVGALDTLRLEGVGTPAETVADYLELMLFTGLRRNEAAQLTWGDISFEARTLTVSDTKNRNTHILPLPENLQNLLKRRFRAQTENLGQVSGENLKTGFSKTYVFQGDGAKGYLIEPRAQVRKVVGLSGVEFTIHDLRRTFSMIVADLDINAYKQKRLLNHKTMDVTAGYTPIDLEQLRKPMDQVSGFILRAAGRVSEESNVIGLSRAGQ